MHSRPTGTDIKDILHVKRDELKQQKSGSTLPHRHRAPKPAAMSCKAVAATPRSGSCLFNQGGVIQVVRPIGTKCSRGCELYGFGSGSCSTGFWGRGLRHKMKMDSILDVITSKCYVE